MPRMLGTNLAFFGGQKPTTKPLVRAAAGLWPCRRPWGSGRLTHRWIYLYSSEGSSRPVALRDGPGGAAG